MAIQFSKQPREVVDYDIDMTEYFEPLGSDEIVSALIEVDPTTSPVLEVGPGVHAEYDLVGSPAHTLKIWLGGGVDGTRYKVTAVITTADARVEEVEFFVKVRET